MKQNPLSDAIRLVLWAMNSNDPAALSVFVAKPQPQENKTP